MIAIDTDVLAISLFYHHDTRFTETIKFLEGMPKPAGPCVYGLLELCGIAKSHGRIARQLFQQYLSSPDTEILYPPVVLRDRTAYWQHQVEAVLAHIEKGVRLGDASVLWAAEAYSCESLITWNKRHFDGKTTLSVMTPAEWLSRALADN